MKKRKRSESETWPEPRAAMKKMLLLFSDLPLFTEQNLRDIIRKEFPDEVEEFMDWLKNYWVQKGREEGRRLVEQQMRTAVLTRLRRSLKRKAVVVSTAQRKVIRKLSQGHLEQLLDDSPTDLDDWLSVYAPQGK